MLIISLLAVSFLTQVTVLAAPIPLNDISLKVRAPSSSDEALFSRAEEPTGNELLNMFAWVISRHVDLTLECFETNRAS